MSQWKGRERFLENFIAEAAVAKTLGLRPGATVAAAVTAAHSRRPTAENVRVVLKHDGAEESFRLLVDNESGRVGVAVVTIDDDAAEAVRLAQWHETLGDLSDVIADEVWQRGQWFAEPAEFAQFRHKLAGLLEAE